MEALGREEIECIIVPKPNPEVVKIISSVRHVTTSKEDWMKHLKKICSRHSDIFDEELVDSLYYKAKKEPYDVTQKQYDWIKVTGLDKIFGEFKIK